MKNKCRPIYISAEDIFLIIGFPEKMSPEKMSPEKHLLNLLCCHLYRPFMVIEKSSH